MGKQQLEAIRGKVEGKGRTGWIGHVSQIIHPAGLLLILSFASRLFTTFYYPLAMKSLRKSLNGNKDNHHHHISTPAPLPALSKPSNAVVPPKKVIRALGPYKSTAPQELSFEKGDFFHVINELEQGSGWYEANNPITGARGLVPKSKFEEFKKSNAA